MTVCIAAICTIGSSPAVLVCADRLVSAGIQFESGAPKIIPLTEYCIVMGASYDSVTSESILEKFGYNLDHKKRYSIAELSNALSQECIAFKTDTLDREVVHKYSFAIEKLHAPPDSLLRDTVNELEAHDYPVFQFIVTGIDDLGAHIYIVEQDGSVKSWNSLGFATIGSGGSLAFSEMTKWPYDTHHPPSLCIPRIYFAKRASERAEGVGASTDYGLLSYRKKHNSEEDVVGLEYLSMWPDLMNTLDEAYQSIRKHESDTIGQARTNIEEMQKTLSK